MPGFKLPTVMRCPGCKADLFGAVNFCPQCGVRLDTEHPPGSVERARRVVYCTHCGAEQEGVPNFCWKCRRRMKVPSESPAGPGSVRWVRVARYGAIALLAAGLGYLVAGLVGLVVGGVAGALSLFASRWRAPRVR